MLPLIMSFRSHFLTGAFVIVGVCSLSAAYEPPTPAIARPLEIPRMMLAATEFQKNAVVVGGRLKGSALREAAAQNPVTWEWRAIAPLKGARAEFGLAEVGGALYAVGGTSENRYGHPLRSVERLDRIDGEWMSAPSLVRARQAHGVAALNGILYACGGLGEKGVLHSCELYIPGTDEWRPAGSMPEARWDFGMAAVNGRLYAVGGSTTTTSWSPSDQLLIRDQSGSWSRGPRLPKPLFRPAVVSFGGRLYVTSGAEPGGYLNGATFVFDPATERWQTSASTGSRGDAAALAWQGQIYVLGGATDGRTATTIADAFDPAKYEATRDYGTSAVTLPNSPGTELDWIVEDGLARVRGKEKRGRIKARHKACPSDVALVIGVEHYRRAPAVRYAQDDAAAFSETVQGLGVPSARTRLITGKDATLPGLRKNIDEWLPSLAASDSRIIVYFSGAGTLDLKTGRRFLMPLDGDPDFVDATGYPLERLYDSLRHLPAREILVVLDAGFSGTGERSIFPAGLRPLVPVRDDSVDPRITVIMAGGIHDAVWSSAVLKGGALTMSLVDAIDGRADANHDGFLTIEEAFAYTRRNVRKATLSAASPQTPTLTTSSANARLY